MLGMIRLLRRSEPVADIIVQQAEAEVSRVETLNRWSISPVYKHEDDQEQMRAVHELAQAARAKKKHDELLLDLAEEYNSAWCQPDTSEMGAYGDE